MKHDLSQYWAIAPIAPVAISPIHSLSREWVKDLMFIMGGQTFAKSNVPRGWSMPCCACSRVSALQRQAIPKRSTEALSCL